MRDIAYVAVLLPRRTIKHLVTKQYHKHRATVNLNALDAAECADAHDDARVGSAMARALSAILVRSAE